MAENSCEPTSIADTASMMTRRAKRRARPRSWEQWRQELVDRLETLHMLAVEIDAFQSAFEMVYREASWPSEGAPERRQALNRMSCFADQVRQGVDDLLRDSLKAVEFAMKRAG